MLLSVKFLLIYIAHLLNASQSQKCPGTNSMGTVLFSASDVSKQCWSPDEIAILTARMLMEDVLPEINVLYIDSDAFVNDLVDYFKMLINTVREQTRGRKKRIMLLALTDLIGGYLQHAVLPLARQSFYSGLIDYTNIEKLIELFEEMKWYLRTNGQGWASPIIDIPTFEVDVIDLKTESFKLNTNKSCCTKLIYYEHDLTKKKCLKDGKPQSSVHFPLPFFDSSSLPTAIAIPFRKYSVRNIESRRASYVLLKYFITASQCLLDREANQDSISRFHNSYYSWIQKDVLPKLNDDKFYSAFGGVLRVQETLKSLGADTEIISHSQNCEEGIIAPEAKPVAKNSTILIIAMVAIISIWFIIGTGYICYRMNKNRKKMDKTIFSDPPMSSAWSMVSTSSRTDTGKSSSCKCHSSEKLTDATTGSYSSSQENKDNSKIKKSIKKPLNVCYPPRKAPFLLDGEKPAVIEAKQAMKMLPSIAEMSEHSSFAKDDPNEIFGHAPVATSSRENVSEIGNKKKLSFSMDPEMKLILQPCPKYATKARRRSFTESILGKSRQNQKHDDCYCSKDKENTLNKALMESSADSSNKGRTGEETTDETEASAKSPRELACHASFTGDHNNDYPIVGDKPYAFGYNFQTTSSSDLSEDDDDMKTSTSKTSGK